MLKLCHRYVNLNFIFFFKKQADDLAILLMHTYSETWILHSIIWYMQHAQLIITYLKFFPISFEYLYSIGFLSISVIHPGLFSFKSITYSANETFPQHYLLPSPAYFLYWPFPIEHNFFCCLPWTDYPYLVSRSVSYLWILHIYFK